MIRKTYSHPLGSNDNLRLFLALVKLIGTKLELIQSVLRLVKARLDGLRIYLDL